MMCSAKDMATGILHESEYVLDPFFGADFELRNAFGPRDISEEEWRSATSILDVQVGDGHTDITRLCAYIVAWQNYTAAMEDNDCELDDAILSEKAAASIQSWWKRTLRNTTKLAQRHRQAKINTEALKNGRSLLGIFQNFCFDSRGVGTVVADIINDAGHVKELSVFVCKNSYRYQAPFWLVGAQPVYFTFGSNPQRPDQSMALDLVFVTPLTECTLINQTCEGTVSHWDHASCTGKIKFSKDGMNYRVWFHGRNFSYQNMQLAPVEGDPVRFTFAPNHMKRCCFHAIEVSCKN